MGIKTKLSIIVPVYNVPEKYYRACLQSLAMQTCNDVEFIIVNDGSTLSYCEDIAKQYEEVDSRFRYIYKDNGGVSSARNLGIDHAKGDYIMFVDADDIISPDCCEYVMRDVEKAEFDCVLYRMRIHASDFPEQNAISRKQLSNDEIKLAIFNIMGCTTDDAVSGIAWGGPYAKIFRKSVITKLGLRFNTSLARSEDALFCMEFYQNCQTILLDSKFIYIYVRNSESVCRKPSKVVVNALPIVCDAVSSFAKKYNLTDIGYQRQIGYRIMRYIPQSERAYFLRNHEKSVLAIAKEYRNFVKTPILQKYLKLLRSDQCLSRKKRFWCYILTSYLSIPYIIFRRLKQKN